MIIYEDGIAREANADEIAAIKATQEHEQAVQSAIVAAASMKNTLRSTALAKLGLTADEVAALFG